MVGVFAILGAITNDCAEWHCCCLLLLRARAMMKPVRGDGQARAVLMSDDDVVVGVACCRQKLNIK